MNTLKIVLVIAAFFAAIIWYLWYKGMLRLSMPSRSFLTPKSVGLLMDLVGYAAFLTVVAVGFPKFWDAWWTPPEFFWATNAFILICLFSRTILYKRAWGYIGVLICVIFIFSHCSAEFKKRYEAENPPPPPTTVVYVTQPEEGSEGEEEPVEEVAGFPRKGEGKAFAFNPVEAYLDPLKTFTRPSGPAMYVFYEDQSLVFLDTAKGIQTGNQQWYGFPAGKYLVYPYQRDSIYFKWYPCTIVQKVKNKLAFH